MSIHLNQAWNRYYFSFIILITILTGLLFGFDSGIISGAIFIIKQRFSLSNEETQLVVYAMLIGACAGTFFGGKLADYYGRRNMLLLLAYIFIIGSICSALSLNVGWLIIGRLIIGIAIGIASFIAPLYLAEIAPIHHRGKLLLLNSIAITGGVALAYFVNLLFNAEGAWRAMLVISIIPAILLGFGILVLPESPRWMAAQGWLQDAKLTLAKIRNSDEIDSEWQAIVDTLSTHTKTQWNILKNKSLWPIVSLGLSLALMQQITGIDTILYYTPAIFEAAGIQVDQAVPLAAFEIEVTSFTMTIIGTFLIDKIGRRKILLTGLSLMCLSLITLTLILPLSYHIKISSMLLMSTLLLFIASYSISIGCLFWLFAAELFPVKIRGLLIGITTSTSWACTLLLTPSSFGLLENIRPLTLLLAHGLICIISWIICYKFVPETKNVSLETIENNLLTGKSLRRLGA